MPNAYTYDKDGNLTSDTVAASDIDQGYVDLPVGIYEPCKLVACVGKLSKADKPMVQAAFTILSGPHQGADITIFYSLVVKAPEAAGGKPRARGLAEMKAAFAAIGAPLGDGAVLYRDPQKAAKLYGNKLRGIMVQIAIVEETRTDRTTGEQRTDKRKTILGVASAASAAASGDGVEGDENEDEDIL